MREGERRLEGRSKAALLPRSLALGSRHLQRDSHRTPPGRRAARFLVRASDPRCALRDPNCPAPARSQVEAAYAAACGGTAPPARALRPPECAAMLEAPSDLRPFDLKHGLQQASIIGGCSGCPGAPHAAATRARALHVMI